jgi:lipid-A-disaccharide synthase
VGDPIDRRLLIVVGETSGDRHAARLVTALKSKLAAAGDTLVARGVAGPELMRAGVEPLVPMETLAVIGFSGVLARLPAIWSAYRRLLAESDHWRPEAALLVDSPGFNFRIGPALHRRGIPVFYYIAPQVWAWHAERAAAMAGWVRRLAVLFPFEEPLFRDAGVETRFVGHPLREVLAPEIDEAGLRAELGAGPADRLLGLLPGSRTQELGNLLDPMLDAARLLMAERRDLVTVVPVAPGLDAAAVRRRVGATERIHVVSGRTHAVQAWSTACAVASGTATLETALFGTPHVIVYRIGWLNYAIARRVVRLSSIGLSNIVAGGSTPVSPELIQDALTPARLAATLAPWLDDPAERRRQSERLAVVRERLGAPGAAGRAAEWLQEMMA